MQPEIDVFIRSHRVAHLATASLSGEPSVIPICYAFDGATIYSAIDAKPKTVAASKLQRVVNIRANPQVCIVIDDYSDDWSALGYVHIRGHAEVIEPTGDGPVEHKSAVRLLREKYPQYHAMSIDCLPIIRIKPESARMWTSDPAIRGGDKWRNR